MRLHPNSCYAYFLILASCCLGIPLRAQITSGQIEYVVAQSSIQLAGKQGEEEVLSPDVRKMMEELELSGALAKRFTLTFSPGAYEFRESVQPAKSLEMGSTTVTILKSQTPPQVFFTDTDAERFVNSEAIADQLFRYEGQVEPIKWTLLEETIPASAGTLGFRLRTASGITADGDTLLAAYAPALPAAIGPKNYYGTPGAILQLEVRSGVKVVRYRAVSLAPLPQAAALSPPVDGKATTPQRFRAAKGKYYKREHKRSLQVFGRTVD